MNETLNGLVDQISLSMLVVSFVREVQAEQSLVKEELKCIPAVKHAAL